MRIGDLIIAMACAGIEPSKIEKAIDDAIEYGSDDCVWVDVSYSMKHTSEEGQIAFISIDLLAGIEGSLGYAHSLKREINEAAHRYADVVVNVVCRVWLEVEECTNTAQQS